MAGRILKRIIKKVVKKADLDSLLRKMEVDEFVEKIGYRLNSGKFLGELVKWIVFLGFFLVALNVLNLQLVTAFLLLVLDSVINIIVAVIVFVVAVVAARFVKRIAKGAARAMNIKSDDFVGSLASFVVYFLALVTILGLFEITAVILKYIDIIVYWGVAGISLAVGLAFGLGGKERAKEILDKMRK